MYDIDELSRGIINNYPEESCGFILKDDTIVFCYNLADNPEKAFKINPADYIKYSGEIKYIFHSHCVDPRKGKTLDPRTPSVKDMEGQRVSGIPWLIFATEGWVVSDPIELPRTPSKDYLNRPFIWFINDCYTLVQDYYKFELGIELKPYILHDYTAVRKSDRVFEEFIEDYGFKESATLDDLQNGDLFIIDNSGFTENHLAIYHEGSILHQGLLSCKEPIENYMYQIKRRLRYVG
jgi:proteasome lid subunit RPN8/RPN11